MEEEKDESKKIEKKVEEKPQFKTGVSIEKCGFYSSYDEGMVRWWRIHMSPKLQKAIEKEMEVNHEFRKKMYQILWKYTAVNGAELGRVYDIYSSEKNFEKYCKLIKQYIGVTIKRNEN